MRVATSVQTIYGNLTELCHSAFARVATRADNPKILPILNFATAHSRGLRLLFTSKSYISVDFATAHSCGLRRQRRKQTALHASFASAHSQRVATVTSKQLPFAKELCHSAFVRVATAEKQCSALRICCEKVDSFSSVGESGLALTIFPFSFAAKATYVAINDSFGRAIDRFFGANRTGISISYDFAEHPCL